MFPRWYELRGLSRASNSSVKLQWLNYTAGRALEFTLYTCFSFSMVPPFHVLTSFNECIFAMERGRALNARLWGFWSAHIPQVPEPCFLLKGQGMSIYLSHAIRHVSIAFPLRVSPSWNSKLVLKVVLSTSLKYFSSHVSKAWYLSCICLLCMVSVHVSKTVFLRKSPKHGFFACL